jgi:hypothetical protein
MNNELREPSLGHEAAADVYAPTRKAFEKVASVAELLGDAYTVDLAKAFPDVQPPFGRPFGYNVLLQLRSAPNKRGSIILPDEAKDLERVRTQASLVRAVAPMAFHNRTNGHAWVEGPWFQPGDFIRCPMYGGDRFYVEYDPGNGRPKEQITFVLIRDEDAVAPVIGNPLDIVTS